MIVLFFFTVFVLARRQPGNVTLSFHFECDKKSGRGAEKDLTLGAAEVHAVRLEWGGKGERGWAFRGRRRSSARNMSSPVEPTQKERGVSVGEAWGKKTNHAERSVGKDSYPISEDLLPPLKSSHWLSSGDSKHFVHLSWKRCSAAGVTDFNLRFLVVPTRPSVVPSGIVVPVFLDEMTTPALVTHRLNATDCDRVSSRRCFLCLFVIVFLFSLVKKYKYPKNLQCIKSEA